MMWEKTADELLGLKKDGQSFRHTTGAHSRVFPFVTHDFAPNISVGAFLQAASGMHVKGGVSFGELGQDVLDGMADVEEDERDSIGGIVAVIVDSIRDSDRADLRLSLGAEPETNTKRVAQYLSCIGGDTDEVRGLTVKAIQSAEQDSNIVERMIYGVVGLDDDADRNAIRYLLPNRALASYFLQDLDLILSEPKLCNEYLKPLLGFYFYMTVLESSLTLRQLDRGSRDEVHHLFFALDWEKTSQTRDCYKRGLRTAETAIDEMFVHACILEFLNLSDPEKPVDYLTLRDECRESTDAERRIASGLRRVSEAYRQNCSSGKEGDILESVTPETEEPESYAVELQYLYDNVRSVIYETARNEPRGKYAKSFRSFGASDIRLEKSRGRSGRMLNITEELLMLLTVVAIGSEEQLNVIDLFKRFEARGVFLDDSSKAAVVRFFEHRNMIDRKSDSGETQYVKRIL